MVISRQDLWTQLQQGDIAAVYLLFGPETYLRDRAARTITDVSFVEGDLRDFNETSFSLNIPNNLANALAAAQQLPMMATRRVVRVTDLRITAGGHGDTVTEDHEPMLSAYLADPPETSVLILVADELNRVRKMGKFLSDRTSAVEFKALDDSDLAEWARAEIKKAGAEIDSATLDQLIGVVGPDVRRLQNEINKLAAAAMPTAQITPDLIDALVGRSRDQDHFDVARQIVAGRGKPALAALKRVLDDGADPLQFLGLLAYNYRNLMIAKGLMERGADRREVANAVKLRYSDQEPFLAAARRADPHKLASAIKRLAETDLAIKTSRGGGGPVGTRMQLEMLVCELALPQY